MEGGEAYWTCWGPWSRTFRSRTWDTARAGRARIWSPCAARGPRSSTSCSADTSTGRDDCTTDLLDQHAFRYHQLAASVSIPVPPEQQLLEPTAGASVVRWPHICRSPIRGPGTRPGARTGRPRTGGSCRRSTGRRGRRGPTRRAGTRRTRRPAAGTRTRAPTGTSCRGKSTPRSGRTRRPKRTQWNEDERLQWFHVLMIPCIQMSSETVGPTLYQETPPPDWLAVHI